MSLPKVTVPVEEVGLVTDRIKPGALRFFVGSGEVLRFDPDGRAFVRGNEVAQDMAVYEALLEWLAEARADVNSMANGMRQAWMHAERAETALALTLWVLPDLGDLFDMVERVAR